MNMVKNVKTIPFRASLACEVRAGIRFRKNLPYQVFVDIFKGRIDDIRHYYRNLYAFFEECYPSLVKKFMAEQSITREEIIEIFNQLPERGEKIDFRKAIEDGRF